MVRLLSPIVVLVVVTIPTTFTTVAFTLPPSTTTTTTATCRRCRRNPSWLLFLAKRPPQKKHTKKSNNSGGGGGFGRASATIKTTKKPPTNIRNEPPLSAADAAKLNTLLSSTMTTAAANDRKTTVTECEPLAPPDKTAVAARRAKRQKWSQRRECYDEQQSRDEDDKNRQLTKNNKGQLMQVSTNPLIFVMDEFIPPEDCRRVQNNANGCFELMFPERLADVVFEGQESEMDGLLFNTANSREHDLVNPALQFPDGLHMDTNNQCLFRHVTCILYLNDVPEECGGATVFPLARALPHDPALLAARRLLDLKLSHTRSRSCAVLGLQADADLMESSSRILIGSSNNNNNNKQADTNDGTAIRIQPRAGRLLIFFSRDGQGAQDPRTWHAGERIQANGVTGEVTEKRILTLFKEVDYTSVSEAAPQIECTFEQFLAPMVETQRNHLIHRARHYVSQPLYKN